MSPSSQGASASLSAASATIGAGGMASVTAVANETVGRYTAMASSRGVATPAVFSLSNLARAVSVTGVSVGWGTQSAQLQTAADGIRLLPATRNTDLPWLGINQLSITLSQAATLVAGDVAVSSAIGIRYGPVAITGSGTSYTITLAQPINRPDRVTFTIGNTRIATFTRRLDVLPGDFNDDGVVSGPDVVGVHDEWLAINGAQTSIFGDINGDGIVDVTDYNDVRKQIGAVLPPVTVAPIAPLPASQGSPEVLSVPTAVPSVIAASIAPLPTSQGAAAAVVPIGASNEPPCAAASRAHPRPRAEIHLAGRGSRLRTSTDGKLISRRLIERSRRDDKGTIPD